MNATNEVSRVLLDCDRIANIPHGLKLVVVLEANNGITVREAAGLLSVGSTAATSYIQSAVRRGWMYQTNETRGGMPVYRRTARGNLLTIHLTSC